MLGRLDDALHRVQSRSYHILQDATTRATEALDMSRRFLSKLIRIDHDELEIDAAISQNLIDMFEYRIQVFLITSSIIGVANTLYQTVAGVFIVLGDEGNSTALERSLIIIPPAMATATVTGILIFLQQLGIVDKLKELTNVKTDTDYVVSKLQPMYQLAERAESLQDLTKIDDAYKGETSALKQKARRALAKVLKKEDRAVHIRKYRFLKLQEEHAKQEHEEIRELLTNYKELGISLQDIAQRIEEYGAFGGVEEEMV